jgi:catechol 2,3-dioxygenase-like lactoylglutathione lyase family enzyme
MVLSHIGIINESEEEAVRFYAEFLGLEKTREFLVDAGDNGSRNAGSLPELI